MLCLQIVDIRLALYPALRLVLRPITTSRACLCLQALVRARDFSLLCSAVNSAVLTNTY